VVGGAILKATEKHTGILNPELPIASIADNEVAGERSLSFSSPEELDRAWKLGAFYLEIPDTFQAKRAFEFGSEVLAAESRYRAVPKFGELEGFIALDNNQQTKLALSRDRWNDYYPEDIVRLGRQLDELGIIITREVLRQSSIPPSRWACASGGYSSGGGSAFLNFVHYDTRKPDWGLRPHTDYGFVTILMTNAPGLQIEVDGQFCDVPHSPEHFVINFGEAFNYTTLYSERSVAAVVHRVLNQKSTDSVRQSIVYFANPDLDGNLIQVDAQGRERGQSSVRGLFASLERKLTE